MEKKDLVKCCDCNLPYKEFETLDLMIPDQQWKIIAKGCNILCPNCICKRAKKYGGTVVLAWIDQLVEKKQIKF